MPGIVLVPKRLTAEERAKASSIIGILVSLLQVVAFENHAKSMQIDAPTCTKSKQKKTPFQKVPKRNLGIHWGIHGSPGFR